MKQGWEIKRLGEVCSITMGQSPSSDTYNESEGLPFFQGNADFGKVHPTVRVYCNAPIRIADVNDILISVRAPIGAINIANCECCIGRGLASIRSSSIVANEYIYHALIANKEKLIAQGTGSTFKSIGKDALKELSIPVPPREEQERIVAELNCLSGIIAKKKEQLKALDALAESIFYTMFGDPITNEKGWEINIIGNLAEFYNGVAHEGSISEDGQYDVINSKFISTQGGIRKHCDSQIFPLMKNDIVMVMSDVPNGKALAKCYLIETNDKYTLNQRICAFRNYNCFKPIFLYYYLNRHPYYLRFDDGNGQTNLRKNDVLNCPVYIPPLTLQQEFANKIEAIERQKELIKKSIAEVETLFNSRMDYYFN